MKKLIIIMSLIFVLTSCGNKQEEITKVSSLQISDDYYEIASPYKKGVGNNYGVTGVYNNYDLDEIEKWLMSLSTKYFKVNNSYYQAGQYLKEKDLKKLLSGDMLNKSEMIKIDGVEIKPTYISYIHEQNYLDANGKLKGISLGIVLNPYQEYTNEYGAYLYKTINESELIEYGKKASKELLDYLIDKKKLNKNKFMIALYIESKPNSALPGNFRYVGITSRNVINFNQVNYKYEYLKSDYVMSIDTNLYNMVLSLEEKIKEINDDSYLSGTILYVDNQVSSIEINVNSNYISRSDLMIISQIVNNEVTNCFSSYLNIKVYIKENNNIKAISNKKNGKNEIIILND